MTNVEIHNAIAYLDDVYHHLDKARESLSEVSRHLETLRILEGKND